MVVKQVHLQAHKKLVASVDIRFMGNGVSEDHFVLAFSGESDSPESIIGISIAFYVAILVGFVLDR